MPAYVIAEIDVTDPQAYEAYRARVPGTLALYGGTYLARGGSVEALEGEAAGRIVLLRFEDMAAALRWYESPEYQAIVGLRHATSRSRLTLVEGIVEAG